MLSRLVQSNHRVNLYSRDSLTCRRRASLIPLGIYKSEFGVFLERSMCAGKMSVFYLKGLRTHPERLPLHLQRARTYSVLQDCPLKNTVDLKGFKTLSNTYAKQCWLGCFLLCSRESCFAQGKLIDKEFAPMGLKINILTFITRRS